MVIKQLVIQLLNCLTFLIFWGLYSEQLLLKNILKINFGIEVFDVKSITNWQS